MYINFQTDMEQESATTLGTGVEVEDFYVQDYLELDSTQRHQRDRQMYLDDGALKKGRSGSDRRDQTTILKIFFNGLKWYLVSPECPVNFSLFFDKCPFKNCSSRKLTGFQSIICFVEITDVDSIHLFRKYLNRIRRELTQKLSSKIKRITRVRVLERYIARVYYAFNEKQTSQERIGILYKKSPKKTAEYIKLNILLQKFSGCSKG